MNDGIMGKLGSKTQDTMVYDKISKTLNISLEQIWIVINVPKQVMKPKELHDSFGHVDSDNKIINR